MWCAPIVHASSSFGNQIAFVPTRSIKQHQQQPQTSNTTSGRNKQHSRRQTSGKTASGRNKQHSKRQKQTQSAEAGTNIVNRNRTQKATKKSTTWKTISNNRNKSNTQRPGGFKHQNSTRRHPQRQIERNGAGKHNARTLPVSPSRAPPFGPSANKSPADNFRGKKCVALGPNPSFIFLNEENIHHKNFF